MLLYLRFDLKDSSLPVVHTNSKSWIAQWGQMYFKVACYLGPSIYYVSKRLGTWVQKMAVFAALQMYTVELEWTVGHIEKVYTVQVQCGSVNVTQYLEQQLNVNSTVQWDYNRQLDIWKNCTNFIEYICCMTFSIVMILTEWGGITK